VTYMYITYLRP